MVFKFPWLTPLFIIDTRIEYAQALLSFLDDGPADEKG